MSNYPHDDPDQGYEDYEEPDSCDHEDYDGDPISGRAHCWRCGHAWWMTSEELALEHQHIVEYAKWEEREHRRERWRQVRDWFRSFLHFRRRPVVVDDEIPF